LGLKKPFSANQEAMSMLNACNFRTCLLIAGLSMSAAIARAENWPQWRGPQHNGVSLEKKLPVTWNKKDSVAWRLPLPGRAGSTPVVWGDRIFLTTPAKDDDMLLLLGIDGSGKVAWERELGKGNKNAGPRDGNSASPSPVTDGKYVWVFMGTGLLGCYDVDGHEIWKFNVQEHYGKFQIQFGMTSSPVLDGDQLYLQLIHGEGNPETREALVLCFDKTTGFQIWKQPRPSEAHSENEHSYASPTIYRDDKQAFLLTHGADFTIAHSLEDGHELWRSGGLHPPSRYDPTLRLVASPAAAPGLIISPSAKQGKIVAIAPGGTGDITGTKHQLWNFGPTPDVSTPVIHDGLVYFLHQDGKFFCVDAKTGEKVYEKPTGRVRDNRASPVYGAGHVYVPLRDGTVVVFKAGREGEQVATNSIEETTLSSPALSNGRIYLRSHEALWAIGGPAN
jgi:outer membrane protein assembly factor BamB